MLGGGGGFPFSQFWLLFFSTPFQKNSIFHLPVKQKITNIKIKLSPQNLSFPIYLSQPPSPPVSFDVYTTAGKYKILQLTYVILYSTCTLLYNQKKKNGTIFLSLSHSLTHTLSFSLSFQIYLVASLTFFLLLFSITKKKSLNGKLQPKLPLPFTQNGPIRAFCGERERAVRGIIRISSRVAGGITYRIQGEKPWFNDITHAHKFPPAPRHWRKY